ncbi:DUF4111 domain-containing protein [Clostridium estertheticum]|uniref:aminoglycoside adenylyltransferase domain-containing protein n=3 Tax=Clostridium estertheticum TaxID=238834 RepID=UPI001C6EF812|nr:aminoglycoside adenylyltransferase domain-containing protein [Clostridium estertheticum]MBW9169911.1 DUF4111 domain-containing protein [Clostridium estertheticum]WLC74599.1 DUF4111 domain-containing protein [Clostridium estertheticum]
MELWGRVNSIPESVNTIVQEYLDLFESELPNFLESYYIYGSITLGAFNYGLSDIDFIAVVKIKVTELDIEVLKKIHSNIKKKFPETDLMGLYVMGNDLQLEYENEKSCPCFIGGVYKGLEKFEKNSIDAFQLKKYGLTVKGKEIDNFDFTVNWDILIHNMRENLNTYWLNWNDDCKKFLSKRYIGLFVDLGMIEWGVLGVSRLYYTFKERDMTSKVGAGEYVLQKVPQRWHKVINEAMRLRKGNQKSYYKSIFERRVDVLAYIDFIIQESNNLFNDKRC